MASRYWYVILTYVVVQFSVIIGAPLIMSLFSLSEFNAFVYWTVFSFITGLIVTLFILKPDMQMGSRRDAAQSGEVILWSVLGIFMAYFAQAIAVSIEIYVLGIDAGSENTQQIMDITRASPIFMLIPAIIAPILEELIFRKIIFGSLYKRMNFFLAGVLSALIFGFIHGEPQHILIYASMGFVFAFLYIKTKRIIVPIIVHASMNTLVVIAQYSLSPEEMQQLEQLKMILVGG
ncbi:CPBP family intramembrane glutamic endopeptidase [Oceanobacillus massiliensis]|uniref:CPBP family intramembrane glutamic endopeptidase n=1 Tax=Oceanobacillus massiliensis TaxID=1465765 RepID=UPI0005CB3C68|nr:type II CAAX endopeptidase family protein [Oceanobacillus massiliensis]